jgi:hypothetical protein
LKRTFSSVSSAFLPPVLRLANSAIRNEAKSFRTPHSTMATPI